MQTKQLIEIRCPFKHKDKFSDKILLCNKLILRVYPGSSGEAYCSVDKKSFDFEVADNIVHSSVKVQSTKK